jgi:FixJ family two-component response regulator
MADNPKPRIAVFAGLEPALAAELAAALQSAGCLVAESGPADMVFCPPNRLPAAASDRSAPAPVVVVSRLPDYDSWIDALEAGAADYIAAPFEEIQLRWLLETHLRAPRTRSAVA